MVIYIYALDMTRRNIYFIFYFNYLIYHLSFYSFPEDSPPPHNLEHKKKSWCKLQIFLFTCKQRNENSFQLILFCLAYYYYYYYIFSPLLCFIFYLNVHVLMPNFLFFCDGKECSFILYLYFNAYFKVYVFVFSYFYS